MADEKDRPIAGPKEHERAVDGLAERLAAGGLAELVREVERILRYELAHQVADEARLSARIAPRPARTVGRTAYISDIHGNMAGLEVVLEDIARQSCDRIVCLGDLVEGGPANVEVVETLMRLGVACVRGNHDEINDVDLPAAVRATIQGFPERIVEGDVLQVHISPRAIKRKVNHAVEAWNVFDESRFRLTFIGHVHIPLIFGARSGTYGEARSHSFEYSRPLALDRGERYIVCVGSVGYGRDDVGKLRYAIHDGEAQAIEFRAIEGPLLPFDNALRLRGV